MPTVVSESPLVVSPEAAAQLGVCVEIVRRAVREGTLPAVRLRPRGNLLFRRADLERLIAAADPELAEEAT